MMSTFRLTRYCVVLFVAIWNLLLPAPLLAASQADSGSPTKFALVIGNSNYASGNRSLKNPTNDAKLLGQSLAKLGFNVRLLFDLNKSQLISAVSEFSDGLPSGATSLVFFAGHGMQIGGASFLLPVDMAVTSEQSVALRAYPIKNLIERLSASKAAVNILVLDACRDNPFQPSSGAKYRSIGDLGLGKVHAPRGTFIAYSTSPGQLAADGNEANSTYTAALARTILEPNLSLVTIFTRVGDQVRKKTQDDQIPWWESSLNDDYYFQPPHGLTIVAGRTLKSGKSTTFASTDSRGANVAGYSPADPVWYRSMSDYEWQQLDYNIQQRMKYMTSDEVPMMAQRALGGSVVAQTTLGMFWFEGGSRAQEIGSSKVARYHANNTEAVKWLRMAAQAEFPIAQTRLGEMLYRGHGVDRNLKMAKELLTSASRANYASAKLDLLQMNMEEGNMGATTAADVFNSLMKSQASPNK